MDTAFSILVVLSSLTNLVVPQTLSLKSYRAVVEVLSKESRVFSGETVRLKCSVPDNNPSTRSYLWFRGGEQLPQTGQHLLLWKARVQESGKYYCQGWRSSVVGKIETPQSLPEEITVDGGYALLQIPARPSIVGESPRVTCRVRAGPPLEEVFLYKDGVEVLRNRGPRPDFHLTNVTLKDQGMYSCRASWDIDRRTRSVRSSEVEVKVLEALTLPLLEIDANRDSGNLMKLVCHLQVNIPAPAPPLIYYFYKNNNRLGVATSRNYDLVQRAPGMYSCRAKVPQLGIERQSEPKAFSPPTGQTTKPELHSPDPALPASAKSSPQQTKGSPSVAEPTEASRRPGADRSLKRPQPAQGASGSTVKVLNQTSTESVHLPEESVNISGDTVNPNESVDMSGKSAATALP